MLSLFKPDGYVSNNHGFILLDVLLAVTVSLAFFLPALLLTKQTEKVYSHAQKIHQAVILAREEMECTTVPPGINEERLIDGCSYRICHSWQNGPDGLVRHQVEVTGDEGTLCKLVKLCLLPAGN